MDKLSSLIVGLHKTKVASAPLQVQPPELDVFEKLAYAKALAGACLDQNFLEQFEGTELLPQAIALCEQELAMEQRQLQQRMQQMAQNQNTNWEQNCIDEDGIRLQKQQLVLALYKNKAMTPAKQPGDAEIGTPDPAAQAMAPAAEAGTAGAPVEEPAPSKLSALIMKSASEFALPDKKKYPIPDEAHGRNALARASQFASKSEQGTIREAVHRKFPGIHETDASKPAEPTVKKASLLEALEASLGRPFGKKANAMSALVPGAKTTASELGAALRLRTQQRGAQQLAQTLGHVPAPGANPFMARPAVAPPPAWVGKTAGTGREMSPSSSSKPKKQMRRNVQPSVSFGALIDQLAGGAN